LWAEIFREREGILIHFYTRPKKDCLEFPIDLPIQILKMAKESFES
jgi:hypothetical protein